MGGAVSAETHSLDRIPGVRRGKWRSTATMLMVVRNQSHTVSGDALALSMTLADQELQHSSGIHFPWGCGWGELSGSRFYDYLGCPEEVWVGWGVYRARWFVGIAGSCGQSGDNRGRASVRNNGDFQSQP